MNAESQDKQEVIENNLINNYAFASIRYKVENTNNRETLLMIRRRLNALISIIQGKINDQAY